MTKKIKFEDALKRLDQIVSRLEEGGESLEESLKLYEEGMKLTRFCSHRLEEARKKVEILKRNEEGKLEPKPFGLGEEKESHEEESETDENKELPF